MTPETGQGAIPRAFLGEMGEEAWIEVIQKMEEVYSDLIRYEVDLEEKNKALEDAQGFIASVLSSISDVLVVGDGRGRVVQVNRALEELTGFSESELTGRPVRDLFETGGDTVLMAQINHWLADGRVRDWEVRLRASAGPTEPVAMNCSPRVDAKGRAAGLVLIGRPVGELRRAYEALKQAQQQLVQSEKMASIGRLVAGVAHELNNPISFIYGNVHILKRYRGRLMTYLDAIHDGTDKTECNRLRAELKIDRLLSDLPDLVDGTMEGAQRVSDIVKNLKRLSFSESGPPGEVDLGSVIRTAVQWAAKSRKPVEMHLDLPDSLIVLGHTGRLHQVFVNLMENAFDAVADHAGPKVCIVAAEETEWWRVTVRDNGTGIPQDNILKVFDPFFTTKPVGQGTGLGLWISYGIVKDHGGIIEAGTCTDSKGACFTVILPKTTPAKMVPAKTTPESQG